VNDLLRTVLVKVKAPRAPLRRLIVARGKPCNETDRAPASWYFHLGDIPARCRKIERVRPASSADANDAGVTVVDLANLLFEIIHGWARAAS